MEIDKILELEMHTDVQENKTIIGEEGNVRLQSRAHFSYERNN
jgi:hypothetical protein